MNVKRLCMTWLQMYDTGKGKTTKRKEVSGHQGLEGRMHALEEHRES